MIWGGVWGQVAGLLRQGLGLGGGVAPAVSRGLPFGCMLKNDPDNLRALDPGDELYRHMPQHVKDVYRRAKAFRRQASRASFAASRDSVPPGLRSPEATLDFLA